MKNRFIILLIFCILTTTASAQTAGETHSIYVSATGRQRSPQEITAMRRFYESQKQTAQFANLKNNSNILSTGSNISVTDILYTKKQLQLIDKLSQPNELENARYKKFLEQSKTGFTTLLGESDCAKKSDNGNPPKSENSCSGHILPGKGAYFSFRLKNYIHTGWADLGFAQNWFFSVAYLTQSLFVELGDVPVENLTLQSKGIKTLTDFVPANNPESADQQRAELETGVEKEGLFYFNAVKATLNQTYALRSVAYRGKVVTVLNFDKNKMKIDLLNGDERKDVLVVFRVVDQDEKGNIKIVWKELQSKDSPKLK